MSNLQIFDSPEFGQVRVATVNNEPCFMLADVCRVLDIKNHRDAATRLNPNGVGTTDIIDSMGRTQSATFINESNLYKLAFTSRKAEAERFTEWVTAEVLPSIRKHGAYMNAETIEKAITSPDFLIRLANNLKEEQEARRKAEAAVEAARPKVLFADAVSVSSTNILIGELAKILKQNGVDIGQNRLFEWMRNNGYLIRRRGTDYNMPTQMAMDLGIFTIKETVITHSDGHTSISKTVKVTGKGQQYFINKFLGQ